jgi:hypothetical protein
LTDNKRKDNAGSMAHDGTPTSNQHIEASQRTRTRPTMKTGVCAV